jgi:cell division protein FtsB
MTRATKGRTMTARRATRPRRGVVGRVLRSDLLLGLILVTVLGLGVMLVAPPFENYVSARQRVALLEQQAAALDTANQQLERRLSDLDDPVTVELLAREQQGLIRPGEVPYVLIPPESERPRIIDVPQEAAAPEADLLERLLAWFKVLFG